MASSPALSHIRRALSFSGPTNTFSAVSTMWFCSHWTNSPCKFPPGTSYRAWNKFSPVSNWSLASSSEITHCTLSEPSLTEVQYLIRNATTWAVCRDQNASWLIATRASLMRCTRVVWLTASSYARWSIGSLETSSWWPLFLKRWESRILKSPKLRYWELTTGYTSNMLRRNALTCIRPSR